VTTETTDTFLLELLITVDMLWSGEDTEKDGKPSIEEEDHVYIGSTPTTYVWDSLTIPESTSTSVTTLTSENTYQSSKSTSTIGDMPSEEKLTTETEKLLWSKKYDLWID